MFSQVFVCSQGRGLFPRGFCPFEISVQEGLCQLTYSRYPSYWNAFLFQHSLTPWIWQKISPKNEVHKASAALDEMNQVNSTRISQARVKVTESISVPHSHSWLFGVGVMMAY